MKHIKLNCSERAIIVLENVVIVPQGTEELWFKLVYGDPSELCKK